MASGTRCKGCWFSLLSFVLLFSAASLPAAAADVKTALDRLLSHDSVIRGSQTGIFVRSLDRKQTIYDFNGEKPLNPASNIKVVTTSVALSELGVHYQFRTGFYADRSPASGDIQTLYVKGGGDPLMVVERLWRIAGDLRNRGVRRVRGSIVIDGSFFDSIAYPQGWPANPGPQAYYAANSAFAANFNNVAVYVFPSRVVGEPPSVVLDPEVPWVRLLVQAQTASTHVSNTLTIERVPSAGGDTIRVSGRIPVNAKPMIKYRNVSNPLIFSGEVLKAILEERGVEIQGPVVTGTVPVGAVEVFVEESPPLSVLIQDVNKLSNNFMAEQILKTLGAERFGVPGTTAKGVGLLKQRLAALQIPAGEFEIENGSGLSDHTKISARALVRVLEAAWLNQTIRPEFLASLALGGVDGTLEDRHIEAGKDGSLVRVRAKTGSLKDDGVSCISGYINRKDGDTWAFSILMNRLGSRYTYSHRVQDEILAVLTANEG